MLGNGTIRSKIALEVGPTPVNPDKHPLNLNTGSQFLLPGIDRMNGTSFVYFTHKMSDYSETMKVNAVVIDNEPIYMDLPPFRLYCGKIAFVDNVNCGFSLQLELLALP